MAKKKKEEGEEVTSTEVKVDGPMFVYKKVRYRFLTEVLATCTEVELYHEHILKKAQKDIALANKLRGKIVKSLEKYKGVEISEQKELDELKAVLRSYQERVGKRDPIPDNKADLLIYAKEVNEEYEALVAKGETQKSTVFMRDEDGHAILSTHMIIGNFKANLKSMVNNSEKGSMAIKSKVATGEVMSTDIKVVEDFVRPTKDLVRKPNGEPDILERPIRFEGPSGTKTAIAMSEYIAAGAEIEFTLRIRNGSPVIELLPSLLELGKNCGIGQWRGSGKKGSFMFKMEDCEEPIHPWKSEGWN
jgi:hypothetical protein